MPWNAEFCTLAKGHPLALFPHASLHICGITANRLPFLCFLQNKEFIYKAIILFKFLLIFLVYYNQCWGWPCVHWNILNMKFISHYILFPTCIQPTALVCTSLLKTSLQTACLLDMYCGRNWWSSEPEDVPFLDIIPSGLKRLGHFHQTSSICKIHHLIWHLEGKKKTHKFM